MVPLSVTLIALDLDFKVAIFFDIEYLRNDTRYSRSYYRTSVGSHRLSALYRMVTLSFALCKYPLHGPLTRFSRSRDF